VEQQIRYCTSADGTRVAYASYGGGSRPPLVFVHSWGVTQEGNWGHPAMRSFYGRLAERRTVVGYDRRGMGASERDISEITLEAEVADLAAVVDKLGLSTFSINAYSAPIAVAYTAANPERVSRLLLWGPGLAGGGAPRHQFGVSDRDELVDLQTGFDNDHLPKRTIGPPALVFEHAA